MICFNDILRILLSITSSYFTKFFGGCISIVLYPKGLYNNIFIQLTISNIPILHCNAKKFI